MLRRLSFRAGGDGGGAAGALLAPARERVVLVVEDERMVRRVQRDVLAEAGWLVLEAASAMEALELVAAHEGPLDVLVTDLELPGLRGCELAARLVAERPGLGIVFTSGHGEEASPCERFPGSRFLQKPFTIDGLAKAVDAVAAVAA